MKWVWLVLVLAGCAHKGPVAPGGDTRPTTTAAEAPLPMVVVAGRAASLVNVATGWVRLGWDGASNSPVTVGGYEVFHGTNGAGRYFTNYAVGGGGTLQLDVPVVAVVTNYYAVAAVGTNGVLSDFSNEVMVRLATNAPVTTSFALVLQGSTNFFGTWEALGTVVVTNRAVSEQFRLEIKKVVP